MSYLIRRARGGGSGRWLALIVVAVGLLTVGRSVVAASAGPSPATAAIPTLTPTQVKAEKTVRTFFDYYNRRDISGILGLLASHFVYFDCDYRRHAEVEFTSRTAVRRWLLARFRDHDYFGPLGALTSSPGPGKVGVGGPVIRFSDSLIPLVREGLMPLAGDEPFKDGVFPNGRLQQVGMFGYCTAGQRLPGTDPKRAKALAAAFLTAYNHHNVSAVVRLLSQSVVYADCGSASGGDVAGIPQVRACLRSRFAEGDTFAKPKVILNGFLVQSGPPYTIMIQALRTNSGLLAQGDAPQLTTLGLDTNASITRIRQVQEIAPPTQ